MAKDMKARQNAREAGEKYYFTGSPCKNGHVAKRATLSGTCVECTSKAAKAWNEERPSKAAEYAKAYRERHPERVKVAAQVQHRKYAEKYPERVLEQRLRKQEKATFEKLGRSVRKNNFLTEDEVRERLMEAHGGRIELVGGYIKKQVPTLFRCVDHDVVFSSRPHTVLRGTISCPRCNHMRSKGEDELADFLAQYTTVERRNREVIKPSEVDVWLPDHNLAIEYHGVFWHTEDKVGKLKHREKWEEAERKGVRLVQIFEDEWKEKEEIVKARLLAFIGCCDKYDARKLMVGKVEPTIAVAFLKRTHIQGAGRSGHYYGLYEEEELRAVCGFHKARKGSMTSFTDDGTWEVTRYASVGRVRGGFGRLLSKFISEHDPQKLLSYCDLRYGDGRLYEVTGFTLEHVTEPDYWWVPRGEVKRIARYNTQKLKLANPSHPLHSYYALHKTEKEICEEAGWKRLFGVGSQRWLWTKPS